jgi:diguanylate cyclase (GGDEF)-like protein
LIEVDATLEKALKASQARQRDRRQRLLWSASTASSYALDGVFLGLFVVAGTIPAHVLYVFLAGAAAICGTTVALYASGWNLKFRDHSVIWPQVAAGVAVHLTVVALAPQVAFPVLANLLTVFAFGVIWLSLRGSVVIWSLTVISGGAVLWFAAGRAGMAASNEFETTLSWLSFSFVLGRCLVLSVYANDMRARLSASRRKLAASLEHVQELASRDELTRSLNRRSLMAALERERNRAERSGALFSVGLIDLDYFKQVNDTYGHATGDRVLKEFSATVHDTMRVADVFGRYGGEEFLMILVDTTPAQALLALERIQAAVAAMQWSSITPGRRVTLSAGVASFRKGENIEQLLNRADMALYEAKGAGRDQIMASPQ